MCDFVHDQHCTGNREEIVPALFYFQLVALTEGIELKLLVIDFTMADADEESPTTRLLAEVLQKETQRRLQAAVELFSFFENEANSVFDFEDVDKLVEGLAGWTNSGNPKICTNGIELMLIVINLLGERFRPYIGAVLPILRERLGDQRQQVRSACTSLLLDMMAAVKSPQGVLDQLLPSTLGHKAWHVREQGLLLVARALDQFGSQELLVGRYMASICKLTEDANFQVREQANSTLVTIYCHVGERIRNDLEKKGVPAARLGSLLSRFDEARAAGKVRVPESSAAVSAPKDMLGVSDLAKQPGPTTNGSGKAAEESSKGSHRYSLPGPPSRLAPGNTTDGAVASKAKTRHSIGVPPSRGTVSSRSSSAAGAVGEEDFRRSFEDCPSLGPLSARAFEEEIVKVEETLLNTDLNWELRATACKRLRSLLRADVNGFTSHLSALEEPMRVSIKDLRSSMMREACITVSLMAQDLAPKMEHFCEAVFPTLFNLLPNSAKVMASSAYTCVTFIIRCVHSSRFIPLFAGQQSAKSPLTRRRIFEYIDSMLHSWPASILEKHLAVLEEAVRKGIYDADSATRTTARSAFWGLMDHFPAQGEKLRAALDSAKQRMLDDHRAIMNGEAPTRSTGLQKPRSRLSNHLNRRFTSEPDLSPMTDRKSGTMSALTDPRPNSDLGPSGSQSSWSIAGTGPVTTAGETTSNSSVSISSGRRSLAHTVPATGQSASAIRSHVRRASGGGGGGGGSSGIGGIGVPTYGGQKPTGGSSTASQSSKVSRASTAAPAVAHGNSRDPPSSSSGPDELQPLEDLIKSFDSSSLPLVVPDGSRRRRGEQDDDVASQGSVASRGSRGSRGSRDSTSSTGLSQSGGASRFHITQDIPEMQRLCSSGLWQERRDGLASLQELLKTERVLSKYEITKFTELFYRMFRDPHHIIVSLFLEVLKAFVNRYHAELVAWLPTLLQRCFHKSSGELRSSISLRLHALLSDVKEKFDTQLQMQTVFQLLEDQSSAVTAGYKLSLFLYLEQLVPTMDPGDFVSSPESMQGLSTTIARSLDANNADVRRSATRVTAALFELNTATFTTMLSSLPRNYQDHARKVMQSHMQGTPDNATGDSAGTNDKPYNPTLYQSPAEQQSVSADAPARRSSLPSPSASTSCGDKTVPDLFDMACDFNRSSSERVKALSSLRYLDWQTAPLSAVLMPFRADVNARLSSLLQDSDREVQYAALQVFEQLFSSSKGSPSVPPEASSIPAEPWFVTQADILTCFDSVVECLCSDDKRLRHELVVIVPILGSQLPAVELYQVVLPRTNGIQYPQVECYLRLLAKIFGRVAAELLLPDLEVLVPRILQCFNHTESSVRHAALNCLVELQLAVGKDSLSPHLANLTTAQAKLVELYVRRTSAQKKDVDPTVSLT
ncbi:CLIP-associating protein 1-like isoform X2 [Sycon ciliatum]|uniref:CLIP-associating protein 1-like isoform X2 n=1 Tax=Sycon ciliatum TaxID=27933 RepID=UPI0031F6CAA4